MTGRKPVQRSATTDRKVPTLAVYFEPLRRSWQQKEREEEDGGLGRRPKQVTPLSKTLGVREPHSLCGFRRVESELRRSDPQMVDTRDDSSRFFRVSPVFSESGGLRVPRYTRQGVYYYSLNISSRSLKTAHTFFPCTSLPLGTT